MSNQYKLQQYADELQKINITLHNIMTKVQENQSKLNIVNNENIPNQDSIDQLQKENQLLLDQVNEYKEFLQNIKSQFSVLMQEVKHLKE
jgi:hypothetical protein